jgi:hypothetical protein
MKLKKILGILGVGALALLAVARTASATTLEINGVRQTGAVTIEGKLSSSSVLKDTSNTFANTCTSASLKGTTNVFTGTRVSGPISTLSVSNCTHERVVVDAAGTLSVEWIKETTGTVSSNGAQLTVPVTILGSIVTADCTTNNTDLGTVSRVSSGTATMTINAVINCGSILPSAKWEATGTVTSPLGLGVTS